MLGNISQWIQQTRQRLSGHGFSKDKSTPLPQPELPPLSDAGYEELLFQLLEGVAVGWQPQQVLSHLDRRETDRFFRSWVQRFGRRLLESPEPHRELARRMVQLAESLASLPRTNSGTPLGEKDLQEGLTHLSPSGEELQTFTHQIGEIGRQLLARDVLPLPEAEYEPMFQRLLIEAARGEAEVLAFLADLSPRVALGQWETWLRGAGEVWLAEAEPNQQVARGLIRLAERLTAISPNSLSSVNHLLSPIDLQTLATLAGDIGRQMKALEVVWEIWEYEERVDD